MAFGKKRKGMPVLCVLGHDSFSLFYFMINYTFVLQTQENNYSYFKINYFGLFVYCCNFGLNLYFSTINGGFSSKNVLFVYIVHFKIYFFFIKLCKVEFMPASLLLGQKIKR
jgi:hypothetical protein